MILTEIAATLYSNLTIMQKVAIQKIYPSEINIKLSATKTKFLEI